jgi:hypothetical protein
MGKLKNVLNKIAESPLLVTWLFYWGEGF